MIVKNQPLPPIEFIFHDSYATLVLSICIQNYLFVICIYLHIRVFNKISISDDICVILLNYISMFSLTVTQRDVSSWSGTVHHFGVPAWVHPCFLVWLILIKHYFSVWWFLNNSSSLSPFSYFSHYINMFLDLWFCNYLWNRCPSPLMLWVRLPRIARWTTLWDKACQWLATGRWFSPGPPVSSINKTDRQYETEILLKVALNTIKPTKQS